MKKKAIERAIEKAIEMKYRGILASKEANDEDFIKNLPHTIVRSAQLRVGRVFNYREYEFALSYSQKLLNTICIFG